MIILQIFFVLIYALPLYWLIHPLNAFIFFIIGLLIAILLLLIDEKFLYRFYIDQIGFNEEKKYQLITRSFLFILAYLVMAVFVITSSGSNLGNGLVMGIALALLIEMIRYKDNPEQFNARFLSQFKNPLQLIQINYFIAIALLIFIFLNILMFL